MRTEQELRDFKETIEREYAALQRSGRCVPFEVTVGVMTTTSTLEWALGCECEVCLRFTKRVVASNRAAAAENN